MTNTTQPRIKRVIVFKAEDVGDFFTTPDKFLKFWQEKFDLIPDEFKDSGYIETNNECMWQECCYSNVEIGYKRLQTEDEAKVEESNKKAKYELLKARNLRELERLKAMYEDE